MRLPEEELLCGTHPACSNHGAGVLGMLQLLIQYRHSHEPGHRPSKSCVGMIYLIASLLAALLVSLPIPGAPARAGWWMWSALSALRVVLPTPQMLLSEV